MAETLIIKGVASLLAVAVCCGGGAILAIRPATAAQPFMADDFEAPGLHQWTINRAAPDRLTRVTSPVRSGRYSLRFSVADSDVKPLTATRNPRAQLNSRVVQREGMHTYVGWSTYFPASFPRVIQPWFVFFQFHGPPYTGSPRISFGLRDRRIGLQRDAEYRFDEPWSAPLERNRWLDFVVGVKWSHDPRVGYVELWYNGERQRFANGSARLRMATIKRDQTAVETIPTNYRPAGAVAGRVTIFQDDIAIGSSYESVAR